MTSLPQVSVVPTRTVHKEFTQASCDNMLEWHEIPELPAARRPVSKSARLSDSKPGSKPMMSRKKLVGLQPGGCIFLHSRKGQRRLMKWGMRRPDEKGMAARSPLSVLRASSKSRKSAYRSQELLRSEGGVADGMRTQKNETRPRDGKLENSEGMEIPSQTWNCSPIMGRDIAD